MLVKGFCKAAMVSVATLFGNEVDGIIRGCKQVFGLFDAVLRAQFDGCGIQLGAQQVGEIGS